MNRMVGSPFLLLLFLLLLAVPVGCDGGGSNGGSGACSAAGSCGGEIAGVWRLTGRCTNQPLDLSGDCAATGVHRVTVKVENVSGTITFQPDGLYRLDWREEGTVSTEISGGCIPQDVETCAELPARLFGNDETSCTGAVADGCTCEGPWTGDVEDEGTWGAIGAGRVAFAGTEFDYCVDGQTLTLTGTGSGGVSTVVARWESEATGTGDDLDEEDRALITALCALAYQCDPEETMSEVECRAEESDWLRSRQEMSESCLDAYRALIGCVAALESCESYDAYLDASGSGYPCEAEEMSYGAACSG